MHALSVGIALASNALGRSKVRTLKPAACISLARDERTERWSSTTKTVVALRPASALGFRAGDLLRFGTGLFSWRSHGGELAASFLIPPPPPFHSPIFYLVGGPQLYWTKVP